jgi:hypothetical protein
MVFVGLGISVPWAEHGFLIARVFAMVFLLIPDIFSVKKLNANFLKLLCGASDQAAEYRAAGSR